VLQSETTTSARHRNVGLHGFAAKAMVLRIAVIVAMCIAAAWFAAECVSHLQALASGAAPSADGLVVSASVFVTSLVVVLLAEVANFTRRFHRPEQQVRAAMQRIRAGDVGFRVALRRGEPLSRLLHECNGLLEWLNRNPPGGARLDADVFEIDRDDEDELA
tara:strand:+ start:29841 stop:30326 length:486 start_codon:yes stop_codon:yes gene_type:complete